MIIPPDKVLEAMRIESPMDVSLHDLREGFCAAPMQDWLHQVRWAMRVEFDEEETPYVRGDRTEDPQPYD